MPEPLTFREVLRIDVMRRVWYAQVISLFGDFLALFAVLNVVTFRMHGTPSQITGIQIAYMLPVGVLGLLSGVFVDRWPLKPTLIVSDLLRAVFATFLIFATSLWQYYLILTAISCVSSFFGPAQSVTIRSHVPREGLLNANSLMQLAFMGLRVIGPATAAALVVAVGPALCYGVDVLSFLASASLIASVGIRRGFEPPRSEGGNGPLHALWLDMQQGIRFIAGHPSVSFVVAAMAAGMFTVGCFGPLIAIYVRETLHASELMYGTVSAMVGVGLVIGTLNIRNLATHASNEKMVLLGLGGIGIGAFMLGALPFVSASVVATLSIGLTFSAIIIPAQTLLQQETPGAMMGRVSSSVGSVVLTAQVLGLVLSGVLAEIVGIRAVFIGCAVLAAVLAGAGRLFLHVGRRTTPTAVAAG